MTNYVSPLLFVVLFVVGVAGAVQIGSASPPAGVVFMVVWVLGDLVLASAVRLAAEWERAVVFRVGKFQGIKGPGLFFIIPLLEQIRRIDTRVQTV